MNRLFTLLALWEGNPPVIGGFPSQRASEVRLGRVFLMLVWTSCWTNHWYLDHVKLSLCDTAGPIDDKSTLAQIMAWCDQTTTHHDVIKWKHFQHYWPFVKGIHQSPVDSRHKGQWRRALVFSLMWAWTSASTNTWDAGDLRSHCTHCDVNVMPLLELVLKKFYDAIWYDQWPMNVLSAKFYVTSMSNKF